MRFIRHRLPIEEWDKLYLIVFPRQKELDRYLKVIGQQKMEIDFLVRIPARRDCIDRDCHLSIVRQCELLEIHRSGLYYQPVGESVLNLNLMRLIDQNIYYILGWVFLE